LQPDTWRTNGDRDYARALGEFEIARGGLPNDPSVFLAIASIERRQGKWKQSIADYEKAASLSPGDPIIIENLALTYQAVRDFPAAAKAFDRAVALVPNSFEAKSLRATVEMEWKGDLSMMKIYWRAFHRISSRSARSHWPGSTSVFLSVNSMKR
jgi:tetratricopeptide (TPR) repeat protein